MNDHRSLLCSFILINRWSLHSYRLTHFRLDCQFSFKSNLHTISSDVLILLNFAFIGIFYFTFLPSSLVVMKTFRNKNFHWWNFLSWGFLFLQNWFQIIRFLLYLKWLILKWTLTTNLFPKNHSVIHRIISKIHIENRLHPINSIAGLHMNTRWPSLIMRGIGLWINLTVPAAYMHLLCLSFLTFHRVSGQIPLQELIMLYHTWLAWTDELWRSIKGYKGSIILSNGLWSRYVSIAGLILFESAVDGALRSLLAVSFLWTLKLLSIALVHQVVLIEKILKSIKVQSMSFQNFILNPHDIHRSLRKLECALT